MGNLVKKIFRFITNADYRFLIMARAGIYDSMQDEEYLRRKFKASMGWELDLQNPKTFNEKLQWLKLYDRKPEYTMMVDKYLVRDYIREKLGEKYLIPLIGVWDSPDEIEFDALPEQFVLKCNHNSGVGVCVCKDRSSLNVAKIKKMLKRGISQDYYLYGREWPYRDVPRKIICEKFMRNKNNPNEALKDYKFQCINGKVDHIFVCVGRDEPQNVRYYYFDEAWKYLQYSHNERCDDEYLSSLKPKCFEEMLNVVKVLSEGIPEIRVDLYEVDGCVYFGELTLYTQSGFDTSITHEADIEIGSHLDIFDRHS